MIIWALMTYQGKSLIRNSQGKGFMPLSGEKKNTRKGPPTSRN